MVICSCVVCGESFEGDRRTAKYCSKICRIRKETMDRTKKSQEKLAKELSPVACLTCGNTFTPSKYRKDQVYCGSKCLNKAMGIRQTSQEGYKEKKSLYDMQYRKVHADKKRELNIKYKDNIRFGGNGSKAMERDGYKCTECGKTNRRALVVHHKDHSGSSDNPNNELSNLVTLCRSCHMKHHTTEENHVLKYRIDNERVKVAVESTSTYKEAAELLGVSPTWVARTAKKLNLARKGV